MSRAGAHTRSTKTEVVSSISSLAEIAVWMRSTVRAGSPSGITTSSERSGARISAAARSASLCVGLGSVTGRPPCRAFVEEPAQSLGTALHSFPYRRLFHAELSGDLRVTPILEKAEDEADARVRFERLE